MKVIVFVLFVLVTAFTVSAQGFPEPSQIIQEEGRFVFIDGSSFYLFKKDGTFKSEPLGGSGRIITGTWKKQDNLFVIQGLWSWINGLSQENDYRKMVLYMSTPDSSETVKRLSSKFAGPGEILVNVKVYKCYFLIDELQKIPKPQGKP